MVWQSPTRGTVSKDSSLLSELAGAYGKIVAIYLLFVTVHGHLPGKQLK